MDSLIQNETAQAAALIFSLITGIGFIVQAVFALWRFWKRLKAERIDKIIYSMGMTIRLRGIDLQAMLSCSSPMSRAKVYNS